MTPPSLDHKVRRLQSGEPPRVLDLFAGCGGLSLGFQAAGCHITAAVENDPAGACSHGTNFHNGDPAHCTPRDITHVSPQELCDQLGLGSVETAFDIIIGGPPCQAFARVGRSKLREIEEHPEAFKNDKRAQLYIEYINYVDACQPLAVLMENVPDMLNYGGRNIAEEICEVLREKGYVPGYTLLNAAYYGVPQMRERVFLVAYRKELAQAVTFPEPTHWVDLPSGYEGSRAVALKLLDQAELFGTAFSYHEAPEPRDDRPQAVSAGEAIGDLPPIYARELLASGKLRKAARRFDEPVTYDPNQQVSDYARTMREWPDFYAGDELRDHVIRYLPRDYPLFARMNQGDQYPEAYQHALDMFEEKLKELAQEGREPRQGTREFEELRKSIVPPYDHTKFPNKWRKLWEDRPARTLMAHLGKDSYSHIHYDSDQARTISVREAARLQSFPDGFVFCGTMNPAFRQIGNAVPPMLAHAVAVEMKQAIDAGLMRVQSQPVAAAG